MLTLSTTRPLESDTVLEMDLLLESILRKTGSDLRGYSRRTLLLHVQRYLAHRGLTSIADLLPVVLRDPREMNCLLDAIVVKSTSFFQAPEFFSLLRQQVLPSLQKYHPLRIWQIGCATGQETWSLAITLAEEGLWEQSTVISTDINWHAVQAARSRAYDLHELEAATHTHRRAGGKGDLSRWFKVEGDQAVVDESLGENILFGLHDVVSDPPFGKVHLILCCNVLMYYDLPQRRHALQLVDESLLPWGYYALGSRETLGLDEKHDGYLVLDDEYSLYQKRAVKLVTAQRTVRRRHDAAELQETVTMPPVELKS